MVSDMEDNNSMAGAPIHSVWPSTTTDLKSNLNMTNTTDSQNITTTTLPNEITEEIWLRCLLIIFYCAIFLLGVSGNSLVVYVVVRKKTMQTITNIFITNLALSDIMMCLLAIPFTPLSAFIPNWIFGDALCHILPMTLGVSVYVSTLTCTAIAIDRYFVIVYPFKPRMKVFVCLLLIVAIWIISISISLPLAIYQKVAWDEEEAAYVCREHWPKSTANQFFTVTSLVLQYIVPCSIITFCYIKVSLVLRMRARVKIGSGSQSRDRDQIEIKRKRRTNKMLIAMVSIFVCCWLPLNVIHIAQEYNEIVQGWSYKMLTFFMAHVIAMSSTIYNPFLYAWMNENFKKEFKTVVPCLFSCGRRTPMKGLTSQYTSVETGNTVLNRSPPKERNGNTCSREAQALCDGGVEKVEMKEVVIDD